VIEKISTHINPAGDTTAGAKSGDLMDGNAEVSHAQKIFPF
jgi:hypothetical protein